jgi:hypothetical protein
VSQFAQINTTQQPIAAERCSASTQEAQHFLRTGRKDLPQAAQSHRQVSFLAEVCGIQHVFSYVFSNSGMQPEGFCFKRPSLPFPPLTSVQPG